MFVFPIFFKHDVYKFLFLCAILPQLFFTNVLVPSIFFTINLANAYMLLRPISEQTSFGRIWHHFADTAWRNIAHVFAIDSSASL